MSGTEAGASGRCARTRRSESGFAAEMCVNGLLGNCLGTANQYVFDLPDCRSRFIYHGEDSTMKSTLYG